MSDYTFHSSLLIFYFKFLDYLANLLLFFFRIIKQNHFLMGYPRFSHFFFVSLHDKQISTHERRNNR